MYTGRWSPTISEVFLDFWLLWAFCLFYATLDIETSATLGRQRRPDHQFVDAAFLSQEVSNTSKTKSEKVFDALSLLAIWLINTC